MDVSTINREALSAKLKKLVGGKSMTQIAKAINIGDASFRSYVNGKSLPSASAIAAMAKYFNIPITELTGEGEAKSTAIDDVKKTLIELSAEERKQILAWLIESV